MGGCYSDYSERSYSPPTPTWATSIASAYRAVKSGKGSAKLVEAYRDYCLENSKGFIPELAKQAVINEISAIPKEFPEIEYEVKFDIGVAGSGKEPSIEDYLDAFDFPPTKNARFLKDPVHNIAEGTNHFIGDNLDEKLVVIEKMGKTYLKEKGKVVPVSVGVQYQEVVVKRTENRYAATMEEILKKSGELLNSGKDNAYRGRLRKEKGDDFVLDLSDGRIYSFTITRAHLTKPGEEKESAVQRQLELEYAGYIPGFPGFAQEDEKQIVSGMVSLAKYTYALYHDAPVGSKHEMALNVTSERKYDFVNSGGRKIKQGRAGTLEPGKEAVTFQEARLLPAKVRR